MSFTWAYLDDGGQEVGRSEVFADRDAAEQWMGEAWQDLLERGVEEVALEDDKGHRIYRMGLRET
jgi:hypothetical protein